MPEVTLPAATIDYRESGPKDSAFPPVVFVHGALVDSRLWEAVAARLAGQGFRCLQPNLPLGSHSIPVERSPALTPVGVAELLHDFLTALDLDDVTLVGNDTGGGVCQFLIDAHPERVGRLVLDQLRCVRQFPPFPFNAVFSSDAHPTVSHGAHGGSDGARRHCATRRSGLRPAGQEPGPGPDRIVDRPAAPTPDRRRLRRTGPRHRPHRSHRRRTAIAPLHQTRDSGVGPRRPLLHQPALGRRLAALFPDATTIDVYGASTFVPLDNPAAVSDAIMQTAGARA